MKEINKHKTKEERLLDNIYNKNNNGQYVWWTYDSPDNRAKHLDIDCVL